MHYENPDTRPIHVLLEDLGQRIARYRLSRNLRQEDVAEAAGLNRVTVGKLERGGGNLETLARVMRALGLGDRILDIVPDARIRPMDSRSTSGEPRLRARPRHETGEEAPWSWGDE